MEAILKKQKGSVKFVNKDNNLFFSVLKKRVDTYFKNQQLSKHGNVTLYIKTAVLLLMFLVPFTVILFIQPAVIVSLSLWVLMGVAMAGLGMSVMHDGNHGAYSASKKVNYLVGKGVINFLGASAFNWHLQHNILHHTYTNVHPLDEDISDKPMLRLNPNSRVKKNIQYQWWYAFFFYGLTTLYWVVAKDFLQFHRYNKTGVNNSTPAQKKVQLVRIIAVKLVYLAVVLGLPLLVFKLPVWPVLAGFFAMHFVCGLVLTVIFQLAHSVEGTQHPLPNSQGQIENDWAIHQMLTTVNFSRNNKLLSWYIGGLNFQIEHHLFPRISHVHYPQLSRIVQQTAAEYGVPYLEHKTFGKAIASHVQYLKKLGRLPDMDEAIG